METKIETRKIVKWLVVLVLGILCVVVFFQNTASVETRFLFINVKLPQVVLLAIVTLIGFIMGWFLARHKAHKSKS